MSIPRPDTWRVFQIGGGLPDEQQTALYGPQLTPLDKDNPIVGQSQRAASNLQVALRAIHTSKEALNAAFPALGARRIRQRALLLPTPDGHWFPVAHLGRDGYWLLTEAQAHASIQGRDRQIPPPGGFADQGVLADSLHLVNRGADTLTNTINSPVPRALLALMTAFATGVAAWRAAQRLWPRLADLRRSGGRG